MMENLLGTVLVLIGAIMLIAWMYRGLIEAEQRLKVVIGAHQTNTSQYAQMVAERNAWEELAVAFARFELHIEKQIASNEPALYTKDEYKAANEMFKDYATDVMGPDRFETIREKAREAITY